MIPNRTSLKRTRLIGSLLLVIGLWILLIQPITASEIPEPADSDRAPIDFEPIVNSDGFVLPEVEVTPDGIAWCPANANICRVNRQFTVEEIKAKLQARRWNVWQDGNQLNFAFYGHVPEAYVIGGFSLELAPINNSDYWVATLQIANLDRAVITHVFGVRKHNDFQLIQETYGVWRGENAPQAPDFSSELQGYYDTELFYSAALDEIRLVSYYLPPNYSFRSTYPVLYMTDGQALGAFAQVVEPLIEKRIIPPMILVGVHSPYDQPTRNRRAEEYILGLNNEAYLAHEQFFTETVRRWSELRLHASEDPAERAIMGFSNGAVFAGNTGVRKPDLYGQVIMFSQGDTPLINLRSQVTARYYLAAGTLEPQIHSLAQRFHFTLLLLDVESRFRQRISGHDFVFWQEELVHALQWMFTADK